MSIHLPDLIAEEQQRNAASAAVTATSEEEDESPYVPNTTHLLEQPIDSAALLAKLRAQLVRREAAASDAAEMDRNSVITDDNEQDFFDLSEMMEYGASEGHPSAALAARTQSKDAHSEMSSKLATSSALVSNMTVMSSKSLRPRQDLWIRTRI